jgi:hypothetical protein
MTAAVKTYDSTATSAMNIIRDIAREARRDEKKKKERAKDAGKKIFTADSVQKAPETEKTEQLRNTAAISAVSQENAATAAARAGK